MNLVLDQFVESEPVQSLVLKIRFQALFTQEEIATARDRLKLYGYSGSET